MHPHACPYKAIYVFGQHLMVWEPFFPCLPPKFYYNLVFVLLLRGLGIFKYGFCLRGHSSKYLWVVKICPGYENQHARPPGENVCTSNQAKVYFSVLKIQRIELLAILARYQR